MTLDVFRPGHSKYISDFCQGGPTEVNSSFCFCTEYPFEFKQVANRLLNRLLRWTHPSLFVSRLVILSMFFVPRGLVLVSNWILTSCQPQRVISGGTARESSLIIIIINNFCIALFAGVPKLTALYNILQHFLSFTNRIHIIMATNNNV